MYKHFILLSGGLDSTSLLVSLLDKGVSPKEILALSFKIQSQQNPVELKAGGKIAKTLGVKRQIIPLHLDFGKSLMKAGNKKQISSKSDSKGMEQVIVPFRNPFFFSVALNWLLNRGYKGVLYYGAHKDDIKFPDCTPAFVKYMKQVVYLGSGRQFTLKAPFVLKKKRQLCQVLKKPCWKHIIPLTYSCYMGTWPPCGKCQTCLARLKALK